MNNRYANQHQSDAITALMNGDFGTTPAPKEDTPAAEPFTYTNRESDRLSVYADRKRPGVVRLATEGRRDDSVFTLVSLGSEEAAELAQALLDHAGDGGRVVVPVSTE